VSTERSSLFFVPENKKIVQNKAKQKISELAESVFSDPGFFLVDVEVKGGSQPVVWVYIDREDRGVTMDECAKFSNELSFLLDAHDIFPGKYRLNVSSPGLARPLSDKRQYPKNVGRKARIKYKTDEAYHKVEGILQRVDDEMLIIEQSDGSTTSIDYDAIVEAKIIPTF
jgi:ribosome maturation factor RimP